MTSHVEIGLEYCRDVASGKMRANEYVRLRCQKTLDEIKDADNIGSRWKFEPSKAEKFIKFAEVFENIKGSEGGKKLKLMPWQKAMFVAIFGIVERSTGFRKYRVVLLYVPKGNGKTAILAPISLYLTFCEDEPGADGFASAQNMDQARLLFSVAKEMVVRSPAFQKKFGVEVRANSIFQSKTASCFKPISAATKSLQGKSVQFAAIDEIASSPTDEVYQSLRTAMAKRSQPLLFCVGTTTSNMAGIGKVLWDYGAEVLQGKKQDERLFALIYCADAADDPWDEETWKAANPSWGHAGVKPDEIRSTFAQARNNGALESGAFTFHLNLWRGADEALFSTRDFKACADTSLRLNAFIGRECHLALDLASKTDLAGLALVFPTKRMDASLEYVAFTTAYLNEEAIRTARNASYPEWRKLGHLVETAGNETDYSVIESDIRNICKKFKVLSIAYDPWSANYIAQRLLADGLPVIEFPQNVKNLSEPTKELQAAIIGKRFKHDGNPVLAWCMSNVVGHFDIRGNVSPNKDFRQNKIDLAVAVIMGVARSLTFVDDTYHYRDGDFVILGETQKEPEMDEIVEIEEESEEFSINILGEPAKPAQTPHQIPSWILESGWRRY